MGSAFSITCKNNSNIPLVVQIGTIGVHRHAHLKVGEEVSFKIGPGMPLVGWTIWAHISEDSKDDTSWGDILLAPILAASSVVLAVASAGVTAYFSAAAAGAGAALLGGPIMIVGEAAFVAGTTTIMTGVVGAQIKQALEKLDIPQSHLKLKSSNWSSTVGQRCQITGGMKVAFKMGKDASGEAQIKSGKVVGCPLKAAAY